MARSRERMVRLMVDTGVYLVTEDGVPSESRLRSVSDALAGGARIVQLRDKTTPRRLLLDEAREMKTLCRQAGAIFLVNDDVALAWCADADGVHVGQDDLPPEEARRLLGDEKLIGLSTHSVQEAQDAQGRGVDYIGVGAMFPTTTKIGARARGIQILREVRAAVRMPLVAIGGIDAGNARDVFEAGADAVAVVRGVFAQPDAAEAARQLLGIARESRAKRE